MPPCVLCGANADDGHSMMTCLTNVRYAGSVETAAVEAKLSAVTAQRDAALAEVERLNAEFTEARRKLTHEILDLLAQKDGLRESLQNANRKRLKAESQRDELLKACRNAVAAFYLNLPMTASMHVKAAIEACVPEGR